MLDFTSSEKRVIFIIAGILIIAGAIQLFQPFTDRQKVIDYSESDSVFSRLSHQSPVLIGQDSLENESKPIIPQETQKLKSSNKKLEKFSVNINTAGEAELVKLPRIGPAIAKRIITFRNKNGPFKSIEDLQQVKGIGKKTIYNIKPYLQKIY